MRKLMMMAIAALCAHAASAEDSYLYWMVGEDAAKDFTYDAVAVSAFTGDDAGSLLTLYYGNGNPVDGKKLAWDSNYSGLPLYASLTGVADSSYSYVVELFNDSVKVGQSASLLYTDAMARNYVELMTTAGTLPVMSTWSAGGFTAVPEPNSAMLVILGCAALALRRRKPDTRG